MGCGSERGSQSLVSQQVEAQTDNQQSVIIHSAIDLLPSYHDTFSE
jgi:hypothetical protein